MFQSTRAPAGAPESRAEKRDRERTRRVELRALAGAGGSRETAPARLRVQARASLQGSVKASAAGAGDERVIQLVERALRLLRAAGAVERGAS